MSDATGIAEKPTAVGPTPWLARYPAGLDWHEPIAPRPLWSLLDDAVARWPHRPCIDFLGRRLSFAEVGRLVDRAARGLKALGVGPGRQVGLFLPNCPYFVILYYAVLKAGGIVVNFNPLYAEAEILHQIEDSETELMVTLDLAKLYDKLAPLLGRSCLRRIIVCPLGAALPLTKRLRLLFAGRGQRVAAPEDERHLRFRRLIDNEGGVVPAAIDPAATTAVLQYTGGTTGVPKAAMLSHAALYANTVQCGRWFAEVATGRVAILGVLPLFHCFAMTVVMNWSLHWGAEMILLPRFELPELLRTVHRKRPAVMPVVPTILAAMNNAPHLRRWDLTSLRLCISGGAPLPAEVRERFEARADCSVLEGYGLSETAPVLCCNPPDANRPGSVGLPYPGTSIEIVSLDAPDRLLPPGETGEICARGPQLMAGYWRQPAETARAMRDGRFHTGDVGRLDADGYLFITDRLKEMIIVGGFKVYPRLVEEAIYAHEGVAECAVLGVPDAYRGQAVKAVVAPRPGVTLDRAALERHLADRLSRFEQPTLWEFRAELPKTAVGKLDKKPLLAEHVAAAAAEGEGR
jgi:long-chain acyl-CoA synthetase